ncbi:MAG: ATP-binding protein [Hyphomicrobium sp.]
MTALFERLAKVFKASVFRLVATAVVLFVLSAAMLAGILFWQSNKVLTEQVLVGVRADSEILQREAAKGGETLAQAVATVARPDGPGLYFLADSTGAKIAGNLNRMPPEIAESPQGGVFTYTRERNGIVLNRLAVAIPVEAGEGVKLFVGRDIEDQRQYADSVRAVFLIGFGTLSLLGLLGGLAVSRFILNRMDDINQTSRSIIEGDLSRRIPLQGNGGELDHLSQNLNDMLDRIEGLMGSLREVSDNIAHDLKTPLNRLRNSAEAALRDSRGEVAYREGLERTIEKADELIKTFNALLLIARLEAAPLQDSLERFDLSKIIEDVSDLYIPAAEEKGFVLSVEVAGGPIIQANRQLIGQAVSNLIDNAIKYSQGQGCGSAITVRAGPGAGGGAMISVGDRGPGIPAKDRERVLRRFVRLEESRTEPGTGLGLSLVAAVARLHGGEVRLEDNEPGLRVVLLLPQRVVVGQEHSAAGAKRTAHAG